MSGLQTPQKTEHGSVIEIPAEMAEAMGVTRGSVALLQPKAGTMDVEVLPPISDSLRAEVREIAAEFAGAFAEMKRRGD